MIEGERSQRDKSHASHYTRRITQHRTETRMTPLDWIVVYVLFVMLAVSASFDDED